MVKVMPKNEEMMKLLRHPTGVGFLEGHPADWPDDPFTTRRLQDGDIVLHESAAAPPTPAAKK